MMLLRSSSKLKLIFRQSIQNGKEQLPENLYFNKQLAMGRKGGDTDHCSAGFVLILFNTGERKLLALLSLAVTPFHERYLTGGAIRKPALSHNSIPTSANTVKYKC